MSDRSTPPNPSVAPRRSVATAADGDLPLRIAFLTYRGKPHVGGQGVYTRHLSKALSDLGHEVEVLSGQPFPIVDERVPLVELPSLDIYNDQFPMRLPGPWEVKTWGDFVEVANFMGGSFSEPLAFSVRAYQHLRRRINDFDLVQDNQSLGYGLLGLQRAGLPVLATVHHPITVDRRLEMEHAENPWKRLSKGRWYGFTKMQSRVANQLPRVITVSQNSLADIHADHGVPLDRLHVVPVGVDQDLFRPLPEVGRIKGRLITTASADVTMKGLRYLLEAVAKLRTERHVELLVIGRLKEGGPSARIIDELGLRDAVTFVTGVPDQRIIELYSEAEVAVVPSLYEGFSLPAIEAMSCGVPLVATTGGALPEVVGPDNETALVVPPGDVEALTTKIALALDDAELRARIGAAGRQRVIERWTWRHTAVGTVEQYRALLAETAHVQARRPGGAGQAPRYRRARPGVTSITEA
ncbi:glycosyltransferase family 4 protein [Rhabdothermincola salaria]|uniref:glycosyltransferase family 4 protein n=1 Tax=Rhabdothermincola salaria TaxID=2903142 RepID=UPI001E505141|nr:glycosyltransferase family 4 protein [Rhabdothermincola salaria]MCD9624786.1 glycosyltransferase family 4 protein [Rhabdothermincola salaria]